MLSTLELLNFLNPHFSDIFSFLILRSENWKMTFFRVSFKNEIGTLQCLSLCQSINAASQIDLTIRKI